jgi:GTP-binding protein HflX
MLERALASADQTFVLTLDHADGAGLAWAYEHGRVLERQDRATGIRLKLAIDPQNIDRFLSRYGKKLVFEQAVRKVS